ncbi:unnamed protein product [Oppiella nova]|uniref:Uncharacterized protein n=1 Tax=Oppiella nova TaxID=334625 RepID=A0A7R9LCQ8_9ACAR|nr:unnamed protein product [Oppiella nova]CAG2161677.1 unnamed protein product [Oppiella nova]
MTTTVTTIAECLMQYDPVNAGYEIGPRVDSSYRTLVVVWYPNQCNYRESVLWHASGQAAY